MACYRQLCTDGLELLIMRLLCVGFLFLSFSASSVGAQQITYPPISMKNDWEPMSATEKQANNIGKD